VPDTRSLLVTVLSILCATVLCAACALPAAASQTATAARAKAACARNATHATKQARASARRCRAAARRARRANRKGHSPKLRPLRQHRTRSHEATPAESTPETEPTTAETQPPSQSNAATIAAVLASTCQNTELSPEAANIGLVRAAVLCLINRKRAEVGESPLVTNPQLERAAEEHGQELVAVDYFAHVSPSGETPVDRIRATGYIPNSDVGYVIGENLAWGTYQLSTPQAIVSAWIASPGHLANILEAKYRDTGIGITPAVPPSLAPGAPGATYAQEFGVIVR
jgi:uncharacterized protein YkwD